MSTALATRKIVFFLCISLTLFFALFLVKWKCKKIYVVLRGFSCIFGGSFLLLIFTIL